MQDEALQAAFEVTKTADRSMAVPGDEIRFLICIRNTGERTLHSIVTTERFQLGNVPVKFLEKEGVRLNKSKTKAKIEQIAPGEAFGLEAVVTLPEGLEDQNLVNEVSVTTLETGEQTKIAQSEIQVKGAEEENLNLNKTVRIFPHRMKGEGHFLALLQKGEKQEEGKRLPESGKNKKLPEELEEFLGHIDRKFDSSRMDLRGEKVYYMPEGLPTLRGIRFLRTGLLMGELKKNRFEPSQALAMNLKKEEYDQVIDLPLEDERVMKYLKGETLDVEDLVKPKDKGWYLICVDGYPLGFGKLVNQMLKNKYLPGWRWNS